MTLLQLSVSGAVLIAAVTALRAVAINRLPKKIFLILWEISIVRLLLPVSIPSVFSVYSLLSRNTPIRGTGTPAAALLPSGEPAAPLTNIRPTAPIPIPEAKPASAAWIIYLSVAVLLAAFFIGAYIYHRMEFAASLPVSNEFTREWLSAHPLKRRLQIRESDRILSPLTYGIFRPVILMPRQTDWQNRQQLTYVLGHEYIHIRRWDALAKLAAAAVLVVHWFNPLVWVMYFLFNRDIELSCDESLIRNLGADCRSDYALTLIGMEAEKTGLLPFYNSFSKNAIEERITAIMKTKKLTIAASAVSVAVLMAVVLVFATSAKADNSTNEIETAKKRLTVYYNDSDNEMHDLTMPDGTSYEWDMDSVKEINVNGTKGYSFEIRWTSDEEKNGQMAGRLAGIYGVSKDGLHYYDDTDGDSVWEEYPAAKRIFPVAPDAGKDYPVCGIIRDMTEDTLTVEVVEFITRDDTDRIRELGLTEESNMPDGYHINMDNSKQVTWKLTDWTSYIFIDWGGDFTGDQEPGGGYCITMDRSIFEEYLSGYPSFEEMKMPFFFRVEDGAVTGIFEYPFM